LASASAAGNTSNTSSASTYLGSEVSE